MNPKDLIELARACARVQEAVADIQLFGIDGVDPRLPAVQVPEIPLNRNGDLLVVDLIFLEGYVDRVRKQLGRSYGP